jgi:hypothetical protein
MHRFLAVVAVLATGCLDNVEGPNTTPDTIGRECTMAMSVTGSFTQSTPAPLNPDGTAYEGCWPVGTWTFSATMGTTDCTMPPSPLGQYQFKIDLTTDADGNDVQVPSYMTDPSVRNIVKVSQGGDGLCEGELDLFSADGKQVWIIKPELYADNHLGGDGEFSQHKTDQWVGDN